jgi:hypothetical protein
MDARFKMDPEPTTIAPWHEVYVSFDRGRSWYAFGGSESPIGAMRLIEWYKGKYGYGHHRVIVPPAALS